MANDFIPKKKIKRADHLTLRVLLERRGQDFFWQTSDVSDAFRPSVFFNEILSGYLTMIEMSHQNKLVHYCKIPLEENMYLKDGDPKFIRFNRDPVAARSRSDFDKKRGKDYRNLANLIEMIHGFFVLPPINEENAPELQSFLSYLRTSKGKELWIKEHISLWNPDKRFGYFFDLDARCRQVEFKDAFETALRKWNGAGVHPDGWWTVIRNDKFLLETYKYKGRQRYYKNSFKHLVRFSRNVASHYSIDKKKKCYTKSEIEWKLYKHFPFLLGHICEVVKNMDLCYA